MTNWMEKPLSKLIKETTHKFWCDDEAIVQKLMIEKQVGERVSRLLLMTAQTDFINKLCDLEEIKTKLEAE